MKPSIPKGTRDFSAKEIAYRSYITNTIKKTFASFGFEPIETPSFENSETLMGKYGEEGDRLIFNILDSGDYLNKVSSEVLNLSDIRSKIDKLIEELDSYINNSKDLSNRYYNQYNDLIQFLKRWFKLNSKYAKLIDDLYLDVCIEKLLELNVLAEYKISPKLVAIEKISLAKSIFFNYYKKNLTNRISEKALRYDLTVPFARYVVQNQNEITFPFKRYQIQPVWRADRPQKGRFREFYQCDADVVGSDSLIQEIEFVQLYDTVFTKLGLEGVTIKINNRKILSGIAEIIGASDKLIDFTVALDKLDKIGEEGVVNEMKAKGISDAAISKVKPLLNLTGSNQEQLKTLEDLLSISEEGKKGVEELRFVMDSIENLGLQTATLALDVTLARGLNYYTGAIFEVAAPKSVKMGSIGGGGRYDDLTGIFGLKDVSGVGISFGLDRIYLVLEELGLFRDVIVDKPDVLFLNFDENQVLNKLKAIQSLRSAGIKSEIYPDVAGSNNQQKKQWKYADKRAIPFVISSLENDQFNLKDRVNNLQKSVTLDELIAICSSKSPN